MSAKIEVPLENDLDLIHVNCMSHFVFQTKDIKNNILFYVCPRCSLTLMVGEIHPEIEQQPQEQAQEEQQEQAQEQAQEQPQPEKHKKRKVKVEKTQNE